jgi:hypothetical protein
MFLELGEPPSKLKQNRDRFQMASGGTAEIRRA